MVGWNWILWFWVGEVSFLGRNNFPWIPRMFGWLLPWVFGFDFRPIWGIWNGLPCVVYVSRLNSHQFILLEFVIYIFTLCLYFFYYFIYFFYIILYLNYYINFDTYFFYSYNFDIFVYPYCVYFFICVILYFLYLI